MANYKTYRIGDVVELCTETNSDLKYGLEHVRGISNTKEIQQTKANLIERNLAPFHVVRRNEFVYNRRTSRNGERVGLGFNNTDETLLITEDYVHFRVKDENQLNPDYLYLFFKRDEFDREARYNSWGSATEFFNWDDMQAIKINVPPIEEQRRIVSEYQTVERRIQNNELSIKKLEETAQAIYHHTFVEGIDEENLPEGWKKGALKDIVTFRVGGDKPKVFSEYPTKDCNYPIYSNGIEQKGLYGYTNKAVVNDESITISARGNVGTCFLRRKPYSGIVRLISVIPNNKSDLYYLYFNLSKRNMQGDGSAQSQITVPQLESEGILMPPSTICNKFYNECTILFDSMELIEQENLMLVQIHTLLTSKLA